MNPEELKSEIPSSFFFSQSSLQDYSDCPRRFQLRYIEHLSWPAIETEPVLENERHLRDGQLFHHMVQQHLLGLPVEVLNRQAKTPDLIRWWENYLQNDFAVNDYTQYTELTLIAPVGSHRLIAKFDLLAIQPGKKAIIFDWKTNRKRPRDERMAARMQTRVYPALLVNAGRKLYNNADILPDQIEMIYWYADFPSEPAHFPYSKTRYQRDWDALTAIINEIGNHRYFPMTEDDKKCTFCPYRSYCNRGVKAGAMDEAELDADDLEPEISLNYEQIAEIEF